MDLEYGMYPFFYALHDLITELSMLCCCEYRMMYLCSFRAEKKCRDAMTSVPNIIAIKANTSSDTMTQILFSPFSNSVINDSGRSIIVTLDSFKLSPGSLTYFTSKSVLKARAGTKTAAHRQKGRYLQIWLSLGRR
jgi:hypothetical protein